MKALSFRTVTPLLTLLLLSLHLNACSADDEEVVVTDPDVDASLVEDGSAPVEGSTEGPDDGSTGSPDEGSGSTVEEGSAPEGSGEGSGEEGSGEEPAPAPAPEN